MTPAQQDALARLTDALAPAGPAFADHLSTSLDDGTAQIWPGASATILTLVQDVAGEHPRRVLHLMPFGDEEGATALLPGIHAWAATAGCTEEKPWALPVAPARVTLLSPERAAQAWPDVEAWVAAAMSTTFSPVTLEDVRRGTASGGMQLWVVMEGSALVAVAVTMFREREDGLRLSLGPIGGEGVERWAEALDEALTAFARLHRCRGIISEGGRRGWARIARSLGWREGSTVYAKTLTEEEDAR